MDDGIEIVTTEQNTTLRNREEAATINFMNPNHLHLHLHLLLHVKASVLFG